jgi:hypothetical protein
MIFTLTPFNKLVQIAGRSRLPAPFRRNDPRRDNDPVRNLNTRSAF